MSGEREALVAGSARVLPASSPHHELASKLSVGLLGALTVVLGFRAGGFFPDATGFAAAGVAVALAIHVLVAPDPFAGVSRAFSATLAAFVAYGLLVLLSLIWSDSPARAVIEFDRALLYILLFALGASVVRSPDRIRWIARVVLAAASCICLAGLLSRTLPDLIDIASSSEGTRLRFPLTYWNSLGLLATIGVVLSVALASDEEEPSVSRVLAAASTPALTATLLLTFSRGAIAAGAIGLIVLIAFARTPALVSGLVSTAVPGGIAIAAALGAPAIATTNFDAPEAISQGHELLLIVGGLSLLGVGLRVTTLRFDWWLEERLPSPSRATIAIGASAAAALVAVGILLSADTIGDKVHEFTSEGSITGAAPLRERLSGAGNNGRLELWRVAVDAFDDDILIGNGAGTYQLLWERDRDSGSFQVQDGHSLYLEDLAELGLAGLLLLATVLVMVLWGLWRLPRHRYGVVSAGMLAAVIAWAAEAGIDWVWEMPAVSGWVFFTGGAVLAGEQPAGFAASPRMTRILVALGFLIVALLPIQIGLSQLRLNSSRDSFAEGNCSDAIDAALGSIDAFGGRPEPYAILSYCDTRLGEPALSAQMMRRAISLDPDNWEYHYGLALVRGVAGSDPRPELQAAAKLNRHDAEVIAAIDAFAAASRHQWVRISRGLKLPTG